MSINKQLLGKSIRQMRHARGLSQATLAERAGLQGNSVALIERGQRGVSVETLNALAEALEIPAACLAMLGTSKTSSGGAGASLVSSLQKLIVATVDAQTRLQAQERVDAAKAKSNPVQKVDSRLSGVKSGRPVEPRKRAKAATTRKSRA